MLPFLNLPTLPGVSQALTSTNIFDRVNDWADTAIEALFSQAQTFLSDFSYLVVVCLTIYVALMGFAMLGGRVTMSPQDAMVRLSKIVLVVLLFNSYSAVAGGFYELFFVIPEAIAYLLANTLNSGISDDTYVINTITALNGTPFLNIPRGDLSGIVASHSFVMGAFTALFIETNDPDSSYATVVWFVGMSPIIVAASALAVARFVMALLLFLLPLIALAALFGRGFGILATWVKVMMTLGLTIIMIYITFGVAVAIMTSALVDTIITSTVASILTGTTSSGPLPLPIFTLYDLAPLGVLSLVIFVIISQIPSVAGSIVGAAGINTQQVSGFINIAALQLARR